MVYIITSGVRGAQQGLPDHDFGVKGGAGVQVSEGWSPIGVKWRGFGAAAGSKGTEEVPRVVPVAGWALGAAVDFQRTCLCDFERSEQCTRVAQITYDGDAGARMMAPERRMR